MLLLHKQKYPCRVDRGFTFADLNFARFTVCHRTPLAIIEQNTGYGYDGLWREGDR